MDTSEGGQADPVLDALNNLNKAQEDMKTEV